MWVKAILQVYFLGVVIYCGVFENASLGTKAFLLLMAFGAWVGIRENQSSSGLASSLEHAAFVVFEPVFKPLLLVLRRTVSFGIFLLGEIWPGLVAYFIFDFQWQAFAFGVVGWWIYRRLRIYEQSIGYD